MNYSSSFCALIGPIVYIFQERCQREKCKYLHPPKHLKTQLETNGRMLQHQQQQMAMQQQLMQQQMLSNPALVSERCLFHRMRRKGVSPVCVFIF